MSKSVEIYETATINDNNYAEHVDKIVYGKSDNLLKFISSEGIEQTINFKPVLGAGYIDLNIAKIEYGNVSVKTGTNGKGYANFSFPSAFKQEVKMFVISQSSGDIAVKVKGGYTGLSTFSVTVEEGTSEYTYKLNWIAIGV